MNYASIPCILLYMYIQDCSGTLESQNYENGILTTVVIIRMRASNHKSCSPKGTTNHSNNIVFGHRASSDLGW